MKSGEQSNRGDGDAGRFTRSPVPMVIKCPMSSVSTPISIDRTLDLLKSAPTRLQLQDGYLDLLGDEDPTGSTPGPALDGQPCAAPIYERLWRPLGGRLLMGAAGPGMRGEHRIALEMLALAGGEQVLDVACGPGNFTRSFAQAAGDGLVVGLDASRTMLARAVQETDADNVAYLRGDACALPFRDASFDAICCFAALYLIECPMRALDEIARVLSAGRSGCAAFELQPWSRAYGHHQPVRSRASPACVCSRAMSSRAR